MDDITSVSWLYVCLNVLVMFGIYWVARVPRNGEVHFEREVLVSLKRVRRSLDRWSLRNIILPLGLRAPDYKHEALSSRHNLLIKRRGQHAAPR